MNEQMVLKMAEQGVYTILIVSLPILGLALAVGLMVSIFQATTQIQEQTLAFIPKIVAVFVGIIFLGPWMLSRLIDYSTNIFSNLNMFVG
ncbi:flagellar biosynthesis protein FliQ (plasmid) [Rossellomorea sp. AcN35-11]|nr:flagellar biosynthesis protein FliQ [Rossellomorea aquimaris]WJV32295.1 flagellar biosynthesis protein FliQ [Rossellomorea sp. AcN35-11]